MLIQKKTKIATIAAVLIVSVAIFASLEFSKNEAYGQQVPVLYPSREKTIIATGSASTSIAPDLVTVQFGVDTEAKTAQDAISSNSKTMNAVVTAVQNLGLETDAISTAGLSIYPVYEDSVPDPTSGIHKSILTGYRASNTLYVKTGKLDLAGNIIDTAVSAGANRVDNVAFSLSPVKQQSTQDDLIGKAVLNAKSRAEKALDPLGQKIIGVKMVTLSDFNVPSPPVYGYAAPMAADKSTPIFSSNQDVNVGVSVIFLIGDQ